MKHYIVITDRAIRLMYLRLYRACRGPAPF